MHIYLSLYYVFYIILLSSSAYNSFCLAVLFILFQYFKYLSNISVYERGPYQFCPSCSKMTLQHYVHCNECKECVPVSWSHSRILNSCSTDFHIHRYQVLVHIVNTYIAILLILYGVITYAYFFLLLFHLYVIYKTMKEKNINITTII